MSSRKHGIHHKLLILILFFALLVRLINYLEMKKNNPIFDLPIVDAREYVNNANYYLNKNFLGPPGSYFHPPLYSYFIAFVFAIFGKSISAIKIVQIVLDLINILLIFYISKKIFCLTVGYVSALLYALYIPAIYYSLELLPPILAISLLLLSIFSLLNFVAPSRDNKQSFIWLILSGLSFGLLTINLANFIISLPLISIWLFYQLRKMALKIKLKYLFFYAFISLAPAILVTCRNYLFARESVFISHNGGINFYIGNNANINETVGLRPGTEYDRLVMIPYEQTRITNFADQQRFWYKKAFEFIKKYPHRWFWIILKKAVLFFNAFEFPRNFDAPFFEKYSIITRFPIIRLNIVLPLSLTAVIFCFMNWKLIRNRRYIIFLLLLIFSYSFSIILFHIAGRYRLPVIPLLIIFASYCLVIIIENLKSLTTSPRLSTFRYFALLIILIFLTRLKYFHGSYPYTIDRSETYAQIGNSLTEARRFSEAYTYFQKGLHEPVDSTTYLLFYYLASYHYLTGDTTQAIEYFYASLKLKPDNYRVYNDLGYIYKMRGDIDSAIFNLNKSKSLAPAFTLAYLNLADCYIARKDWDRLIASLESYYRVCLSPSPIISNALGNFYMDIFQDWRNAARHFELTIRYPHGLEISAETYNRLGSCYYYLKNFKKAKEIWIKGLRIDPHYQPIKENLKILGS